MSAKVFLRHLNNMSTFNLLQDKLTRLNDTYLVSIDNRKAKGVRISSKYCFLPMTTERIECTHSRTIDKVSFLIGMKRKLTSIEKLNQFLSDV